MQGVRADGDRRARDRARSGRAGIASAVRVLTATVLLGAALLIVALVGQGAAGARGLTAAPGAAAAAGVPPALPAGGGGLAADGAAVAPASPEDDGRALAEYAWSRDAAAMMLAQAKLPRAWGGPGMDGAAAGTSPQGPRPPGGPGTGSGATVPRYGEGWRPAREVARPCGVAEAATGTDPAPPESVDGILQPVVSAARELARATEKFGPGRDRTRPVVASIEADRNVAWRYETRPLSWLMSWFTSPADVHARAQTAIDKLTVLSQDLGAYADKMASDLGSDGEIVRTAVREAQGWAEHTRATARVPLGMGGRPYVDLPEPMVEQGEKLYGLVMEYTPDPKIAGLFLKISDDAKNAKMYAGYAEPGAGETETSEPRPADTAAAQRALEASILHLEELATAVKRFADGLGENRQRLRAAADAAAAAAASAAAELRRIRGDPPSTDGEDGGGAPAPERDSLLEDHRTPSGVPADEHAGGVEPDQGRLGAGGDLRAVEPAADQAGPGTAPPEQHAAPDTRGVPDTLGVPGGDPLGNSVLVAGGGAPGDGGVPSSPDAATAAPVRESRESAVAVDVTDATPPDGDPGPPSFGGVPFADVGADVSGSFAGVG